MIKTIAHLADIHIRKLHRFVEYRQVFKNLYKQLKDLKPDAIYIGGDVVHGKLDTSPEEVRMVANCFLSLCKIAPTIVIPGNHDCNLNNKSREDTLSPIVDWFRRLHLIYIIGKRQVFIQWITLILLHCLYLILIKKENK